VRGFYCLARARWHVPLLGGKYLSPPLSSTPSSAAYLCCAAFCGREHSAGSSTGDFQAPLKCCLYRRADIHCTRAWLPPLSITSCLLSSSHFLLQHYPETSHYMRHNAQRGKNLLLPLYMPRHRCEQINNVSVA